HGPAIVAEARPRADDLGRRRRCERFDRRELFEESMVLRSHAVDLGLLEHDFGDQDVVWIARAAPGQVAGGLGEPRHQCLMNALQVAQDAVSIETTIYDHSVYYIRRLDARFWCRSSSIMNHGHSLKQTLMRPYPDSGAVRRWP